MSTQTAIPMPPGLTRRPKVGVVLSYIGHYHSVQVLHRFLHLAGCEVITSRQSTAPTIEAGTSMTSSDFCFPLRVYVGHVYTLSQKHPDLDAILAPNIWTDHAGSATCCKYRDIGGTAIRSLGGMVPYLQGHERAGSHPLPRLIRPNVQSPSRTALRNVAFEVYAELLGLPSWSRMGFFLPPGLRRPWAPHVAHVESAFERAWEQVLLQPGARLKEKLADEKKPRLALVGRRYLIDDPALSADLKPWFSRAGAVVLTAADVPWTELEPLYRSAEGYYDTHREGHAFIDWAMDKVDGFITLGAFGCHPDAFQVDYLAEYARSKGKPAWTFRFDETVGNAGFQTRFETIYGFLEGQRDRRLNEKRAAQGNEETAATLEPAHSDAGVATESRNDLRPLFVWPYMGEELNLILEELFVQLGLRGYALPPKPIDGSTLELGTRRYAETCSPFACATGSLMQSVREAVHELRTEAANQGKLVEPRRFIALMLQGEGPCTFGWYAIAQNHHLSADLAPDLTDGHTVELVTMGLKDPVDIIRQLARLGDTRRLAPLVEYIEARVTGAWARMSQLSRLRMQLRFQRAARARLAPIWAKLAAAEAVRARSLLVRAHELEPGSTTVAYHDCMDLLRAAHTRRTIRQARQRSFARLKAVPQDRLPKPRVVAVGEIYVVLTSFSNRGVIEKLMGQEGIEVEEGISLSHFIRRSLREWRRRTLASRPFVKPVLKWLAERGVEWLKQSPGELRARPLLEWEVGGEGMPGVAAARALVENGCDGVLHVFPFKCMPEGVAKDAYKELSDLYQVRYLSLTFDKETEIERVKTEVATFAALLRAQLGARSSWFGRLRLIGERKVLGYKLDRLYRRAKQGSRRPTSAAGTNL
ncbi:MAG TPA: acyl-CoA dehydratase activase-related protein [Symbiobacteriaceae bacterium]|nr:acyl-CoA dehydratase activase-related protein [Symbiobacteriaceae bacterium]